MSIFDKFRKTRPVAGQPESKPETAEVKDKAETPTEQRPAVPHGYDILVKPLLSEKAMHLAGMGRYVFMVGRKAGKPEIKKSIQKLYNVHVEDVKIVNLPSKKRRSGQHLSQTSAAKKAIVILKKGEKLPGIIEAVG